MNRFRIFAVFVLFLLSGGGSAYSQTVNPSPEQLAKWLNRFPKADVNKDGELSLEEAEAFRKKLQNGPKSNSESRGAPRTFEVDSGWDEPAFPKDAVFRKSPEEIAAIYEKVKPTGQPTIRSYEKPNDGSLRIVGTGHSFMAPGYRTLPRICEADGFSQPLYTHVSGGITGSARYKWEQENGIFEFHGKPLPKLLSSISNAEWDVMMWGPYFNDRPQYYACWIEFCLKYNPQMKFYLSDAWLQLYQLGENPASESNFTEEVIDRLGEERQAGYAKLVETLRGEFPEKVFILPTADAMTLAAKLQMRGELPGIEGLHRAIGGKERSLWRDQLGHLGPGFERLEGYVFYATLYGKSPALIEGAIDFGGKADFPSPELDSIFREIAWQAVTGHPLSGVTDHDGDGIGDVK